MKIRNWLCLALLLAASACGTSKSDEENKLEEAEEVGITNAQERLESAQTQMQQAQQSAGQRLQERIARNDTAALPAEQLAQWLPPATEGYQAKGPDERSSSPRESRVKRSYERKGLNLSIELTDYNNGSGEAHQAMSIFAGIAEVSLDLGDISQRGFKQGEAVKGTTLYNRADKHAELSAVINSRFVLTIRAEQQASDELVKRVFQNLPLEILTKR